MRRRSHLSLSITALLLISLCGQSQQTATLSKKGKLEAIFPVLIKASFNSFNNIVVNEDSDSSTVRLIGEPLVEEWALKVVKDYETKPPTINRKFWINWKPQQTPSKAIAFQNSVLARIKPMATKLGLVIGEQDGSHLSDKINAKTYYFYHSSKKDNPTAILHIMRSQQEQYKIDYIVQLSIMGQQSKDIYDAMADDNTKATAQPKQLSAFGKKLGKIIDAFADIDLLEKEATKNKAAWLLKYQLGEGSVSKIFDQAPGRSAWVYSATWTVASKEIAQKQMQRYAKLIGDELADKMNADEKPIVAEDNISWRTKHGTLSLEYYQNEQGKWQLIITLRT